MSAIQKHTQWIRMMQDHGWSHGDTHDAEAKKHPCMKPWDDLDGQTQTNFVVTGDHDWTAGVAETEATEPERERTPKKTVAPTTQTLSTKTSPSSKTTSRRSKKVNPDG